MVSSFIIFLSPFPSVEAEHPQIRVDAKEEGSTWEVTYQWSELVQNNHSSGVWLTSCRWRAVVQAGFGVFQHLCLSLIKLCLLGCFVACFLRPLTALRGDLFETGSWCFCCWHWGWRTVWRYNLHMARTCVAIVGGRWEDGCWGFRLFWRFSSHLLGMSARGKRNLLV